MFVYEFLDIIKPKSEVQISPANEALCSSPRHEVVVTFHVFLIHSKSQVCPLGLLKYISL